MPKIVTLCGSTKFKEDFERINMLFTMKGYIVLMPGVFGHADNVMLTAEEKNLLDKLHLQKIDMSDMVYVINKHGYIGNSTSNEIIYAIKQGTPVFYLEKEIKANDNTRESN